MVALQQSSHDGGAFLRQFVAVLLRFARQNTVYWIIPLVVTLLLAVLVVLGSQSSAPFIYTLF